MRGNEAEIASGLDVAPREIAVRVGGERRGNQPEAVRGDGRGHAPLGPGQAAARIEKHELALAGIDHLGQEGVEDAA